METYIVIHTKMFLHFWETKCAKREKEGEKAPQDFHVFWVGSVGLIYVYFCGTFDSVCMYVWAIFFLIFYYLGAY